MSENFYITTAIPYVNSTPHIGFALELVQGDVIARHRRLRGDDVRFLTGTDDNSLKNVRAAQADGISTRQLVERNARHFEELHEPFRLSFDDFIRTSSDPRHQPGVEKLWRAAAESGDLYKTSYEGQYCVGCEQFYAAEELLNGRCPEHGTEPETVSEENWFFRLSRYGDRLRDLIESGALRIEPRSRRNEVLAFIDGGLRDFSVSRSIDRASGWGIPVPGDPTQVVYVWFDALSNYITALGYAERDNLSSGGPFRRWWGESGRRVHLIGKGIVRFHAVYWPAMLLSAGLPLPSDIFVHDYLTANGKKIGKSLGNAVDPVDVANRYGVDALRWWLIREVPRVGDADFTVERLVSRANEDLANGLGNLASRVISMVHKYRDGAVPTAPRDAEGSDLHTAIDEVRPAVDSAMADYDLRAAAAAVWRIVDEANRFIQTIRPWELAAADKSGDADAGRRLETGLGLLVDALRVIGTELQPFLPDLATNLTMACSPHRLKPISPLFPRVEADESLRSRTRDVTGRNQPPTKLTVVTRPQNQTTRRNLSGQLSAPLRSFLKTEAGGASLLLAAATIALLWANSPWSESYFNLWHADGIIQFGPLNFDMSLGHWVNDGLMVIFFLVIGMEVRREWSIGELTDRRRAIMPVVAGLGGMVIPILFYLILNPSGDAVNGWGIVIGTDTAFMLGALALVGPSYSTQLRLFLLTLTVVDDIIAVSVIGIVYSDNIDLTSLGVAAVCLLALLLLDRFGVWQSTPYVLVVIVLWAATVISGVHPSIAGMVAGLLIPAVAIQRRHVEDAKRLAIAFRQSPQPAVGYSAKAGLARAVSVNERLQLILHPWTSYLIVPVFALANAGVDLRDGVLQNALTSTVTWGVVIGLVFGKTIGIGIAALLAQRYRIAKLPTGVAPGHVFGGAALSGIGFTVSLLIIDLAFGDSPLADEARVGVLLATVVAVIVGGIAFWIAARWRGETSAGLPVVLDPPVDPERDHIRGPVDAPLTLVEYSDFECPFCARVTGVSEELRNHYGDRLRYVFRHVTLPDVHSHSEMAAHAAEAAANQGKFWEMHDKMFERQDELELEDLAGYAHELDLDVEQFLRDIDDPAIGRRVQDHVAGAEASGVRGTPTFFVGGRRHRGPHDAQSLIRALDETTDSAQAK